tara:strand:+ start:3082 stop:3576 length:495 start_codon:yes stop_codon:yes gene_type:complete
MENEEKQGVSLRKSKKARLYVIGGLLLVVVLLGIFVESLRIWMVGVGIVLLVALGFEVANTDVDLGSVMETGSISDSVIERDENGNLMEAEDGGFLTRILRDKEGNEVPEGTAGAKFEDEYNCDDFSTQPEAQTFYDNAGGVEGDVNRLDGNKDGVPCQALPAN